jgi:hypothetical protein
VTEQFVLTTVSAGPDGVSHFGALALPLEPVNEWTHRTPGFGASDVHFRPAVPYTYGAHPAPRRQLVVVLDGEMTIEVGDGERRTFGPGQLVLAEDVVGSGHALERRGTVLLVPIEDLVNSQR